MTIEERNQKNAQHSTGPRTEEGRAASSLNALKTGLHSTSPLLPGEDANVRELHIKSWHAACNPLNDAEKDLVDCIADLMWRTRRLSRLEFGILSAESIDIKALNTLSLISGRVQKQVAGFLRDFKYMHRDSVAARNARQDARNAQLEDALIVHQADQILNRESTLKESGFVFTPEELDQHIARKKHIEKSTYMVNQVAGDREDDEMDEWDAELDAA